MFPFDVNPDEVAIVVEIRGPIAAEIRDRNPAISYVEHLRHGGTPDSREPTPLVTADETVGYLMLSLTPYPTGGYSFGRSSKCNVILPSAGRHGVSNCHFRIFVSHNRTWMLRNESANVTLVNGDAVQGSKAVHPEKPTVVRAQNITLLIHIVGGWIAPRSCDLGPPLSVHRSGSVQSSTFQPPSIPGFASGARSEYHVLERTRVAAKGSHHAAIHVRTGRRCVAMICDKPAEEERWRWRWRYNIISAISSHNDSIVRYLDFVSDGPSFMIVSEHIDGCTLEQYCSRSTLSGSDLLCLYRQVINTLCYFEEEGIEHGDISPRTILITTNPFKAHIAGFSEFKKATSPRGLNKDVADFSRAYRSVAMDASAPEGNNMQGDPEVAMLIDRSLDDRSENRLSAREINHYIHGLVGKNMLPPFDFFEVTKSWTLKVYRDKSGVYVEVPTLLDRLLSRRREVRHFPSCSTPEANAPKYLRDPKTFDGIKYCTAHRALKFCRAYGLEDFKIIVKKELASKRVVPSGGREIVEFAVKTKLRIGYHTPTTMINFTHIAEAIGWRPAYLESIIEPIILREIADERWGGVYIDKYTCMDFLNSGSYNIVMPEPKAAPNDVLALQFMESDPCKSILLFTGRLKPNMVTVRRTDCFVNWSPDAAPDAGFISPQEACSRCDEEALPSLKKSIEALLGRERMLKWSSWGPSLLRHVEDNGSDTSVNTIESGDDGPFRFGPRPS